LIVVSLSCRDITPYEPYVPIARYGLSGRVTSANGVAIESVAVSISYNFIQYDTTQLDTVNIIVDSRLHIYSVDVFDIHGLRVRNLYFDYPQLGAFPRFFWDARDDSFHLVKSGKYFIRYVRDATILKVVPYLVDGLVTARTDNDGNFTVGQDNLPVGELFDLYSYGGTFEGVYQVTRDINVDLAKATLHRGYTVTLQINNVYHGDFILK
jgi:hypothetical protein